ncbi:MAG TPA: hypothetical protein PK629_00645 [Oscillospiraceae bacterium]|nr:hypothetical protein [Oscillospiraceae bacterium]HPF55133.1 hypothetical protein [Clostridiales bacterium]HPK34549.1 hypothetical protein [Oscillospiraceae bacterium]HPR74777.1 hypothetical protein [Oscillospiraceae bacterium]
MKVSDPSVRPENQLWRLTGQTAKEMLEAHNRKRESLTDAAEWEALSAEMKQAFLKAFPPLLREKCPLNARVVSRHEFEHFRIENVLFESIPGWEVNATLYLPKEPGVYPAVVCPTGSSSKVRTVYQKPCQIFARNGYIALSIDPPGFIGERRLMNDCFVTGQSGFLTGIWSQANYITDTLRCLDYLDTRPDVERSKGYAVSGLSLGGHITAHCGWMDDRITCIAPVCSVKSRLQVIMTERYTAQPTSWYTGFLKHGIDTSDLLCMAAPKPCLIHSGTGDEVSDTASARKVYADVQRIYKLYAAQDRAELFVDNCPHEYSANMANRTVEWMNGLIAVNPKPLTPLQESDLQFLEPEYLQCHPSNKLNYYTLNKQEAERLAAQRQPKSAEAYTAEIKQLLSLPAECKPESVRADLIDQPVWVHSLFGVEMLLSDDVHIPGLLLKRTACEKAPALLFFDENGKWEWLYKNGPLARAARFLERTTDDKEPMVLSMDLSGWGELTPQPGAYDLASWADTANQLAYIGMGIEHTVIGQRVKEALSALFWLENRPDVDRNRIYMGGRGQGALVALLTAAVSGHIKKLLCVEMLSHYGALLEDYPNLWKSDVMIPEVLKHFDLPELAAVFGGQLLLLNPLDGTKAPLCRDKADWLYRDAQKRGAEIHAGLNPQEIQKIFTDFIYS